VEEEGEEVSFGNESTNSVLGSFIRASHIRGHGFSNLPFNLLHLRRVILNKQPFPHSYHLSPQRRMMKKS
jgi:hypothetical protein